MSSMVTDITSGNSISKPTAIEISFRLKMLGFSQSQVARDLKVHASIVSNVIHDRATCFLVANHIAKLLGVTIQELWPDRYVFKPRLNHKQNNQGENI